MLVLHQFELYIHVHIILVARAYITMNGTVSCTKTGILANNHLKVLCAKSALCSTKCMLENGMYKKCSIRHKMYA